MVSRRKLIEWSPLDSSHFLVAASDLRLYEVPEVCPYKKIIIFDIHNLSLRDHFRQTQ